MRRWKMRSEKMREDKEKMRRGWRIERGQVVE